MIVVLMAADSFFVVMSLLFRFVVPISAVQMIVVLMAADSFFILMSLLFRFVVRFQLFR